MEKSRASIRKAALPKYAQQDARRAGRRKAAARNDWRRPSARKAVLYATCYGNYNDTPISAAALAVLAKNGVETEVVYPACCGMPQLEQGDASLMSRRRRARSPRLSRPGSTRATTLSRWCRPAR